MFTVITAITAPIIFPQNMNKNGEWECALTEDYGVTHTNEGIYLGRHKFHFTNTITHDNRIICTVAIKTTSEFTDEDAQKLIQFILLPCRELSFSEDILSDEFKHLWRYSEFRKGTWYLIFPSPLDNMGALTKRFKECIQAPTIESMHIMRIPDDDRS